MSGTSRRWVLGFVASNIRRKREMRTVANAAPTTRRAPGRSQTGRSPECSATPNTHFQRLGRLVVSRRREAVFASCDAGQADELPPAKSRAGHGEFLGDRAIILLGVQCPVFARAKAQQHLEDRLRVEAEVAIAMHRRTGPDLIAGLDRG